MTTSEQLSHEADTAVEQLLLKRNGQKKTVSDVFEVVVAMNHDRRSDTALLLGEIQGANALLTAHCNDKVHMTDDELAAFVGRFDKRHDDRDAIVDVIEADLAEVKENCAALHGRAPRRRSDPVTEDWRENAGGEQSRQVWLMWLLGTAVGRVLVFVSGGVAMLFLSRFL